MTLHHHRPTPSEGIPLELHVEQLVRVTQPPRATIEQRFQTFHEANPWVATVLEQLVTDWLSHGHKRVGIGMLAERLRWEYGRRTHGDEFKLNNDFRSRYARLLVARHPEWADVFELRKLRSA